MFGQENKYYNFKNIAELCFVITKDNHRCELKLIHDIKDSIKNAMKIEGYKPDEIAFIKDNIIKLLYKMEQFISNHKKDLINFSKFYSIEEIKTEEIHAREFEYCFDQFAKFFILLDDIKAINNLDSYFPNYLDNVFAGRLHMTDMELINVEIKKYLSAAANETLQTLNRIETLFITKYKILK